MASEVELPPLLVPDESTVPADLVQWVEGSRDEARGGHPGKSACVRRPDSAGGGAPRSEAEWDEMAWRMELEAARDNHDIHCVMDLYRAAGLHQYKSGNYESALDLYHRAGYLAARVGDLSSWIYLEVDMAQIQFWLGRYLDALAGIERSLPHLDQMQPTLDTVWRQAAALLTRGRIENLLGQRDRAIRSIQRSLEKREVLEANWPSDLGHGSYLMTALQTLGLVLLRDGKFSEAERHLQRAVRLEGIDASARQTAQLALAELYWQRGDLDPAREQLRHVRSELDRPEAYNGQLAQQLEFVEANVLAADGHLGEALKHSRDLVAKVEVQRALSSTELTASFFEQRKLYFDLLVRLLLQAGDESAAFDVVESLRARDLLDSILWPSADLTAALPTEDVQRVQALRSRYAAMSEESSSLGEILAVRDALIQLESGARRAASAFGAKPIQLDDARALLRPDELLLSFWPTDESVVVFVLHGPHGRLRHFELPSLDDLAGSLRRLQDALVGRRASRGALRRQFDTLSEFILHPVERELDGSRHILVSAEGSLGSVPFSALSRPNGRPLVETHSLTHVHSLSVLDAIRQRRRQPNRDAEKVFSAVASPTYLPSSTARPPLRAGLAAAQSIAKLFEPAEGELLILSGDDATRNEVLNGALSSSRFVHVNAHIELDRAIPDLSTIRLAEVGPDGLAGGMLRLRDLRSLRLSADVVTLAGCSSAGDLRRGAEGPMAFPRGLLHVGADSVVASLWPVHETPTADLMHEFYRQVVEEEQAPAEALRRAQAHLARGAWPEPRSWSAFVLLGDGWAVHDHERH